MGVEVVLVSSTVRICRALGSRYDRGDSYAWGVSHSELLQVRVTPDLRARLEAKAALAGRPFPEWLREGLERLADASSASPELSSNFRGKSSSAAETDPPRLADAAGDVSHSGDLGSAPLVTAAGKTVEPAPAGSAATIGFVVDGKAHHVKCACLACLAGRAAG